MTVELEVDVEVHSPLFYYSVATILNCALCNAFRTMIEKHDVLCKSQISVQLYCKVELHKLLF